MLFGGQTNGDAGDSNTMLRDHSSPTQDRHLGVRIRLLPAHCYLEYAPILNQWHLSYDACGVPSPGKI